MKLSVKTLILALFIGMVCFSCHDTDPQSQEDGIPLAGEKAESAQPTDSPLIRATLQGNVKGVEWDQDTYAWLGVPFAKPPVDDLRWKAPRDPDPWEGDLPADEFCEPCSQIGGLLAGMDPDIFGNPVGSEDCLYLNIWRPQTEDTDLPVFLYIHGGMNSVGEAGTSLYHGANLSKTANIVYISINYRLGPLGFFHHKSLLSGAPLDDSGSYGLLDIIKTLEWVQNNITEFGGNPDNVTVTGESAGAANVCSLLGSPLATGLFHRAIAMSPAGITSATSMEQGHKSANNILIDLIISDDENLAGNKWEARRLIAQKGDAWVAEYLMKKSPDDILSCTPRFSDLGMNELGLLVSGGRLADGTVIPFDYSDRFKTGDYNQVPFMVGSNSEEYKMFEITGILPPKFINKDETEICEMILSFDPATSDLTVSDIIPKGIEPIYHLVGVVLGDLMFQGGIDKLVKMMSLHQDVYVYKFGWNEQPEPFDFLMGAGHMMGIPFFLGNFFSDQDSIFRIAWSEENQQGREALSNVMMGYLTNLMYSGDPNMGISNLPTWESWSNELFGLRRIYLDTEKIVMKR
ncbi:MAG: carboxylesterase family protein [Desulfobacterales bacterium]|nr:carboxylesterase family protein [Desulfobacterales bacterium]